MSEQKKDKPKVDVRDLKPSKDAKGGSLRATQHSATHSATGAATTGNK
jgi:hypothetical protein